MKTLLPVLVVFTIMASVLFLVSQIEVPQLEKHFVHEGVISNIQIEKVFGLPTQEWTIVYFQDGAVYEIEGVVQGLVVGQKYWIYENRLSGRLRIERVIEN